MQHPSPATHHSFHPDRHPDCPRLRFIAAAALALLAAAPVYGLRITGYRPGTVCPGGTVMLLGSDLGTRLPGRLEVRYGQRRESGTPIPPRSITAWPHIPLPASIPAGRYWISLWNPTAGSWISRGPQTLTVNRCSPPAGTPPPIEITPAGPVAAPVTGILARPELQLTSIVRTATTLAPPLRVGGSVPVRVNVRNLDPRASARVAVASVGVAHPVNRSPGSIVIPAGAAGTLELSIPIERARIVGTRFKTSVFLVDAATPDRGGVLDQIWKDGNKNDNAMEVSYEIEPSTYTVTATVTRIDIANDCDAGDDPGEYRISFHLVELLGSGDPSLRSWGRVRDTVWPGASGALSSTPPQPGEVYTSVRSGHSYATARSMELDGLTVDSVLQLIGSGREDDSPLADDLAGDVSTLLDREVITRGRSFTLTPHSGRTSPHCGLGSWTAHVTIRSRPAY